LGGKSQRRPTSWSWPRLPPLYGLSWEEAIRRVAAHVAEKHERPAREKSGKN